MADSAENVLLQGFAVTDAGVLGQAIITQGYAGQAEGPPSLAGRIVVNQTGATEQS